MVTFRTTREAAGGNNVGIVVPDEVMTALAGGKRVPVVVTVDGGYTYRTTTAVMGGRTLISFNAATRAATGRGAGDEIAVTLERDDAPRVVDVPAPLASLGTTIDVPTLDGSVPVEVRAGTQPGETITLGGRGMPPLSRGRTGDLRVVVNVTIPRRLTREQRDMLERFSESLTEDNQRDDEGMIAKLRRELAG